MGWGLRWDRWRQAFAATVTAACALGIFRFALRLPPAVAEAFLLLAILAVPLASLAPFAILRRTPIGQRVLWGSIVVAALIGHFHGKVYDTFPFVEWDIYESAPSGEILLFDYYAVRPDATEAHLVPADLFPALRKKLAVHLEQVALAIDAAPDATPRDRARRTELLRRYDALLRALARGYNREHAENPLIAIRIERWIVPVEGYAGRESIVRQPAGVWRLADEAP